MQLGHGTHERHPSAAIDVDDLTVGRSVARFLRTQRAEDGPGWWPRRVRLLGCDVWASSFQGCGLGEEDPLA